jgi:DNA modification methylase
VLTAAAVQQFVTDSGKSSDGGVLFLLDPPGNILKPGGSGQHTILPRDIWTEKEIDLLAETVTHCCKPLNQYNKSVVIIWSPWQLMGAYRHSFEEQGWKVQAPIYAVNSDPHTSVRRAGQAPSTHTYMMFTRIGSGFFSFPDEMAKELPACSKTRYHDHFQVQFALGNEKVLVDTSASKEMLRPEQKCVEEMRRFVAQFSPADGIVVDLFGGTGTTAIAALSLQRRVFMMDADVDCVVASRRRVEQYCKDNGLTDLGHARGV